MNRSFERIAVFVLVLAGASANAMPIGVRTMMHGRAAIRQTAEGSEPESAPVGPEPAVEVVKYGGEVENQSFSKAQVVLGALYKDGELVGTVEVKFGKIGKKGVKIAATASVILDGKVKKVGAKAYTLNVAGGEKSCTLSFKAPIVDMVFTMGDDGVFTLKNRSYEMVGAVAKGGIGAPRAINVGGKLAKERMAFNVEIGKAPDFGKDGTLIAESVPVDEPVYVTGGTKWSFGKAASLKYKKDRATGRYDLLGLDDPAKPNVSGLKLSYTAKTGQFKGSFKLYTTTGGEKPKLKKFTVNVIGFVVDGVGYGQAVLKKPAGVWAVTVR